MKSHYYFAKGTITYKDVNGQEVEEKKQVTYELTQSAEDTDRHFFLGVEYALKCKLEESFLHSRPYIKKQQIVGTMVDLINKLN